MKSWAWHLAWEGKENQQAFFAKMHSTCHLLAVERCTEKWVECLLAVLGSLGDAEIIDATRAIPIVLAVGWGTGYTGDQTWGLRPAWQLLKALSSPWRHEFFFQGLGVFPGQHSDPSGMMILAIVIAGSAEGWTLEGLRHDCCPEKRKEVKGLWAGHIA